MGKEKEKEGLTEVERLRNNIEDKAKDILRRYTYFMRPNALLDDYYYIVRRTHERRQKLKQPINARTGKPLKPITIKQYESDLRWYLGKTMAYTVVIKILVRVGDLDKRPLRNGKVVFLEEYRRRRQVE